MKWGYNVAPPSFFFFSVAFYRAVCLTQEQEEEERKKKLRQEEENKKKAEEEAKLEKEREVSLAQPASFFPCTAQPMTILTDDDSSVRW